MVDKTPAIATRFPMWEGPPAITFACARCERFHCIAISLAPDEHITVECQCGAMLDVSLQMGERESFQNAPERT